MKKRLLFIWILTFIASISATAQQHRTVTNADLEKFRQKRLEALKDYRENYERLGFLSPAELEKNIEQSRVERAELAARLRGENMEREQLDLERRRIGLEQQIAEEARKNNSPSSPSGNYSLSGGGYSLGANGVFFNYGNAPFGYGFPNYGFANRRSNRLSQGNLRRNNQLNNRFNNQPRLEYRNNLPTFVNPSPRIFAPPMNRGGRRN